MSLTRRLRGAASTRHVAVGAALLGCLVLLSHHGRQKRDILKVSPTVPSATTTLAPTSHVIHARHLPEAMTEEAEGDTSPEDSDSKGSSADSGPNAVAAQRDSLPEKIPVDWRQPRWRVLVFANNRLESLTRLCDSLTRAHINETVALNFYLEAGQAPEMYDYVATFEWPHGPVQVLARHSPGGLINAIIEGWYPTGNTEWAIFLEDDIEVSPYFLQWAQQGRQWCEVSFATLPCGLCAVKAG